jgi:sulfur carrier protein
MTETVTRIRVFVNGEAISTAGRTVADLLVEAGYGGAKVATAVNGEFLPERRRGTTALAEGDHIEVVAPRQGG